MLRRMFVRIIVVGKCASGTFHRVSAALWRVVVGVCGDAVGITTIIVIAGTI